MIGKIKEPRRISEVLFGKPSQLVLELRAEELAVETSDVSEANRLRALSGTSTGVGTVTESEFVHLSHHRFRASRCFDLTLRQERELANLRGNEEHSRTVLTSRSTCAATDTGRSVHRLVSYRFRNRNGIRIGYTTCVNGNESTGLHDLVVRSAIDHEVFDYGECTATPRFYGDGVAIFELTHVELAGCDSAVGSVRVTVDVHRAHTTDTLTAVVIVGDRVFMLLYELLVQDINHLQERSTLEYMFEVVGLEMTLRLRSGLTPYPNFYIYITIHD